MSSLIPLGSNVIPISSNFDQPGLPLRAVFIKADRIYLRRDRIVSIEPIAGLSEPTLQVWLDGRGEALLLRGKSIEDLAAALSMPELVPEPSTGPPPAPPELPSSVVLPPPIPPGSE